MQLKDIVNATINKRTKQVSFHLKSKELKKKGLTSKDLLTIKFDWPIPPKRFSIGAIKK